jgi:hypothetical protein
MSILAINKLALELVARDFSDGHAPTNGGPTKTSRALAIIHLAARDAYAQVTATYAPNLSGLPPKPSSLGSDDATGTAALLGAGVRAATLLYPDEIALIANQAATLTATVNPTAVFYGRQVAEAWFASRQSDGSNQPQTDDLYNSAAGHHRRDPLDPKQLTLGRKWGAVTPFVLSSVVGDAPLGPPPALNSVDYAKAFDEVFVNGRDNITQRTSPFVQHAVVGLFWGYDGANKLGTPPRLYNQVVLATAEFQALPHAKQVNVLAAINAAMADAGIAAWHWKYVYDVWRPVVGIREAEAGWGPTGTGDQNTHRTHKGDPFWLPLGAPKSNPVELKTGAPGANFTPNFPAYPSGHATFGAACFKTFAALVGKTPDQISVKFVSDELNGTTTDNRGVTRPKYEQTFTLKTAIEQNNISRIYLGVHWHFDATGGETVGTAVANKTAAAFK